MEKDSDSGRFDRLNFVVLSFWKHSLVISGINDNKYTVNVHAFVRNLNMQKDICNILFDRFFSDVRICNFFWT